MNCPKFYYDIKQRSDEWFDLRAKRMTASHAQAIANCGKGLESYILEKMAQHYSKAKTEAYTSKDMERGNELEPSAITAYEFETELKTQKIGFVTYNDYVGASPDLFVEDGGMAEIKCPNDKTYLRLLIDSKIDSEYMWQKQMQMLCCYRSWCDYVVYNPNFERSLVIERVYPDKTMVEALFQGFKIGEERIKEIQTKMEAE